MQPRSSSNPGIGELLAHAEFVRKLARQLCATDPHGAEDLAQDVWVAALERPPAARGRLASWLATVARNLLASRLRRLSSRQDPRKEGRQPGEDSNELERAEVAEARNAVALAVQRMRDPYREVLILRFYDGLELQAIARRCDRPLETVRTQLRRALVQLRAEMTGKRGPRNGVHLILLAAGSERERPLATALGSWGALILGAATAVLFVGLGWLTATRMGRDSALEAASAAREPTPAGPESDAARSPSVAPEREPMVAEPLASSGGDPDNIPVERGPSLEVEVVDLSGAPVEDARIRVHSGSDWVERARTDASGLASLTLREQELGAGVLPPGVAWLSAVAERRATLEEVAVDTAISREAPLQMHVGVTAGSLRARVVDPDGYAIDAVDVVFIPAGLPSGIREEGAQRRVARPVTLTDSEGRFELERLPVGEGWVHLRHADLGICSIALAITEGAAAERELRFAPGAVVYGVLVDESDAPRVGVGVRSYWRTPFALPLEWTLASTAADGSYALALPAQPAVELWAMDGRDDALQLWKRFDLSSGARVEWSAALQRWDPVRVRLVDLEGAPLAKWLVGLRVEPGNLLDIASMTDDEGRGLLVMPAVGELSLEIHGPLMGARSVAMHVVEGIEPHPSHEHTIAVDGERRGLGGLIARLSPQAWTPPADLQVLVVREEDDASSRAPVDRELDFRVAGLTPGRYGIALSSGERMLGFVAHEEVLPDRTLDLGTLELPPPAHLDLAQFGSEQAFELLAARPDGRLRSCGGVQGGSSAAALLLPGSFVLRKLSKSGADTLQETRFESVSGQRLVFGADLAVQD
jgi:RNA polymerase sigma-70 factor, ECF subfamily